MEGQEAMMRPRSTTSVAKWLSAICLTIAVAALLVRVAGVVTIDQPLYFPLSVLTSLGIIGAVLVSWRFTPWGSH